MKRRRGDSPATTSTWILRVQEEALVLYPLDGLVLVPVPEVLKAHCPYHFNRVGKQETYPCISPLWTTRAPLVFNMRGEIFSALSCSYSFCQPERLRHAPTLHPGDSLRILPI